MADAKVTFELDATGDLSRHLGAVGSEMQKIEDLTGRLNREFKVLGDTSSQFRTMARGLGTAARELESASHQVGGALRGLLRMPSIERAGRFMADLGGRASLLAAPMALFEHRMVRSASTFEKLMNKTSHLVDGVGIKDLERESLHLSRTSASSATEIGDAMARLGAQGIATHKILTSLPPMLKFAEAGEIGLGEATDFTTSILNTFGMAARQVPAVMDDLIYITDATSANVKGLAGAFQYASYSAVQAKVPFRELLALLGALANAGIKDTIAGTSMGMAFSRMLKRPTDEMRKVFDRLGIKRSDIVNAKGELGSFLKVVEMLERKKAKPGEVLQIFEEEAGKAVLALMSIGTSKVRDLMGGLQNDFGATESKAIAMSKGATGAMSRLKNSVEELQIQIGKSGVLGDFTEITRRLTTLTQRLSETNPELLRTVTIAGALTTVAGPIMFGLGQTLLTLGLSAKALTWIAGLVSLPAWAIAGGAYGAWWVSANWKYIAALNIEAYRKLGDKIGVPLMNPALDKKFMSDEELRKLGQPMVPKGISPDFFTRGNDVNRLERNWQVVPEWTKPLRELFAPFAPIPSPTPTPAASPDPVFKSSGLDREREIKVSVSFQNAPRGTQVTTHNPSHVPFQFDLGLAMPEVG